VTSRGDRQEAIFEDGQDRRAFLNVLGEVVSRFRWRCHAYCLMGDHYHLMIETPQSNLTKGMGLLNGVFTQWSNRRRNAAAISSRSVVGALMKFGFISRFLSCVQCCKLTRQFYLLHAVQKKTQKTAKSDLEIGRQVIEQPSRVGKRGHDTRETKITYGNDNVFRGRGIG
jgi:REP element-mobilizing transposase RayT